MDQFHGLSKREREVLKLVLEGKSNKQIALALHITENTVEFHLKNIYSKVQVSSRTELIIKLRDSVVAGEGENAENGDGSISAKWSKSLREAISRIGRELNLKNLSTSNFQNGAHFF